MSEIVSKVRVILLDIQTRIDQIRVIKIILVVGAPHNLTGGFPTEYQIWTSCPFKINKTINKNHLRHFISQGEYLQV